MESTERIVAAARHRIEIKVSAEQKSLITAAAAATGVGISEFVRAAAENAARQTMLKR